MTPELETELWGKMIRYLQRNADAGITVRIVHAGDEVTFLASADGNDLHIVTAVKYQDALRKFVGRLQGNRS